MNLVNRVYQDPVYFIAFGFGSGLIAIAPGTFGTLAAIPLYLLMINCNWIIYLLCLSLAFILGVWVSERVVMDLGIPDYKGIVWDEVVGYLCTMFLAPKGLWWMILGFILFRLFDVWKPGPIRHIDEKIQGGLGVMLDDVLAAIPAWLLIQLFALGLAS